jgi:hypothetical protein
VVEKWISNGCTENSKSKGRETMQIVLVQKYMNMDGMEWECCLDYRLRGYIFGSSGDKNRSKTYEYSPFFPFIPDIA